jgi:hypothetical protein
VNLINRLTDPLGAKPEFADEKDSGVIVAKFTVPPRGHYAFPAGAVDGGGDEGGVLLVKALINPSKNAKKTSTAYPTRKATARGEAEACCEKFPKRPITVPPIAAIKKRAELAADGINVRVLI